LKITGFLRDGRIAKAQKIFPAGSIDELSSARRTNAIHEVQELPQERTNVKPHNTDLQ
jgi:hypothetical protein